MTSNTSDLNSPGVDASERLRRAVVMAEDQFWAAIAESYPEIRTGDLAPDAVHAFSQACLTAAGRWVEANQLDGDGDGDGDDSIAAGLEQIARER